eukprot:6908584-Ditylum_brightwellii.AAC.1
MGRQPTEESAKDDVPNDEPSYKTKNEIVLDSVIEPNEEKNAPVHTSLVAIPNATASYTRENGRLLENIAQTDEEE